MVRTFNDRGPRACPAIEKQITPKIETPTGARRCRSHWELKKPYPKGPSFQVLALCSFEAQNRMGAAYAVRGRETFSSSEYSLLMIV